MLRTERHRRIKAAVNKSGAATVEDLAAMAHVSKATIRRDLVSLEQEKALLRVHGGAMVYQPVPPAEEELPIDIRMNIHKLEKEVVAEAAVKLVKEGSTIYIGAGTTGQAMAAKLGQFHHLTVLTNDIDVARSVAVTDNALIVTGGQLKQHSRTLYGFFTEQMLRELRVDTAFMIVDAVDLKNGFMDYGMDEVSLKRLVVRNAQRCVILCDAAKFNISAFVNVLPLNAAHTVVTNAEAEERAVRALREAGLQVILAPTGAEK